MTRLNPTLTAGQNVLTLDGEFGTVREIRTRGWVTVEIAGTVVNRRAKDLVATELEPVEPTTELDTAEEVSTPSLAAAILNGTAVRPAPARGEEPEGEKVRRNGIVPADYLQRYERTVRVIDGEKVRSMDNGDAVARCLREMTLEEVYEYVSCTLNVSAEELHAKYAHLNNGGQRMNLGNRLRAFLRHQAAAAIAANA